MALDGLSGEAEAKWTSKSPGPEPWTQLAGKEARVQPETVLGDGPPPLAVLPAAVAVRSPEPAEEQGRGGW